MLQLAGVRSRRPAPILEGKTGRGKTKFFVKPKRAARRRIYLTLRLAQRKIRHFARNDKADDFSQSLLELPEQRSNPKLPGLNSQKIDLRGTYNIRSVIWSSRIERKCRAPRRCRSRIGARHRPPGGQRPGSVDVKASGGNRARSIRAELARDDLHGGS